jgi:hypothetical protein
MIWKSILIPRAIAPASARWSAMSGFALKRPVHHRRLPGRLLGCDRRALANQSNGGGAGGPTHAGTGEIVKLPSRAGRHQDRVRCAAPYGGDGGGRGTGVEPSPRNPQLPGYSSESGRPLIGRPEATASSAPSGAPVPRRQQRQAEDSRHMGGHQGAPPALGASRAGPRPMLGNQRAIGLPHGVRQIKYLLPQIFAFG